MEVIKYCLLRFNPRPCARGDFYHLHNAGSEIVSIHAPARGATRVLAACQLYDKVSIHAPARGATPCPRCLPIIR